MALYVFSDFPFDGFSIQFKGHDLYARIHNNVQGLYRSNMLMTRKYCLRSVMSFLCSQNLRKSHKLCDGGLIEADIQNFGYPPVLLLHPLTPYVITGTLLSDMETLHYCFVFIEHVAEL